jgi:hypothetical protein
VDPRPEAEGTRGSIVDAVTESVDVLPTICDFMGVEVPLQADGWSLGPFVRGEPTPDHWRDTAHFEWSFSDPVNQLAELGFGIPMSHCALAVSRGPRYKYVQFAADAALHAALALRPRTRSRSSDTTSWSRRAPRSVTQPGTRPASCCSGRCARPSGHSVAASSTRNAASSRLETHGAEVPFGGRGCGMLTPARHEEAVHVA